MTNPITARCLSALPGIRHGFFTREGGVSHGIYASLNCGPGSGDAPERVIENRRRVAAHLGVEAGADHVLTLYQVHSATAVVVDRPTRRDEMPQADALVTSTPGLVLGALAADCAPVLLADATAGVVAAAHAGWRGALSGVLEAALDQMLRLGADRSRICAAIGPCISQDAYEVGAEFKARFLAADPESTCFFRLPARVGGTRSTNGLGGNGDPAADVRPHFDLPGYAEFRLRRAGLAAVERQTPCTSATDSRFFSYRRMRRLGEADYGRQISAIVVA